MQAVFKQAVYHRTVESTYRSHVSVGYNDVSFHGSEIQTPFLDSLNHAGVELRSYYGHMICTPSRSAVMSGRYAFTTGMQHSFWGTGQDGGLPLNFKTMADHLKAAGYSTHMVGKWHLGFESFGYHPLGRGFDSYYVRHPHAAALVTWV